VRLDLGVVWGGGEPRPWADAELAYVIVTQDTHFYYRHTANRVDTIETIMVFYQQCDYYDEDVQPIFAKLKFTLYDPIGEGMAKVTRSTEEVWEEHVVRTTEWVYVAASAAASKAATKRMWNDAMADRGL